MTLGWPWPILRQGQIWFLTLLYRIKSKTMDFSETIVVYDLKPATDGQRDKKILLLSKLCPLWDFCPSAPGLNTCIKSCEKNVYNQTSKILKKKKKKKKVIRPFFWHQNLAPWGCLPPLRGYTSWKQLYKIRLQRHFFKTCNKWAKWQAVSVDIKTLSPGDCLPLPWGYIHALNIKQIV